MPSTNNNKVQIHERKQINSPKIRGDDSGGRPSDDPPVEDLRRPNDASQRLLDDVDDDVVEGGDAGASPWPDLSSKLSPSRSLEALLQRTPQKAL